MNLELRSERNEDGVVALWPDGWAAGLATERRLLVPLRHTDGAQMLASFFAENA